MNNNKLFFLIGMNNNKLIVNIVLFLFFFIGINFIEMRLLRGKIHEVA